MIEQRCGLCRWFKIEPKTNIGPQSTASTSAGIEGLSSAQAGGSTKPVYGKCHAQFTNLAGQLEHYDMGMVSTQTCQAEDDQDRLLFSPKK